MSDDTQELTKEQEEVFQSCKDKYGFIPVSVKEFENVPTHYKEIDRYLDINLIRHSKDKHSGLGSDYKFSKFSMGICEFAFEFWSSEGDQVIDCFSGWGIREAVGSMLGRHVQGYEITPQMRDHALQFLGDVKELPLITRWKKDGTIHTIPKGNMEIILGDGTRMESTKNNFADMILTCPPYWIVEKYPSIDGQLSDLETYNEFLKAMDTTMFNCNRVLKIGKFCIFVVADFRYNGKLHCYHSDLIPIAEQNGFVTWDIIISVLRSPFVAFGAGNFDRQKYSGKKHEYILVFKKVQEFDKLEVDKLSPKKPKDTKTKTGAKDISKKDLEDLKKVLIGLSKEVKGLQTESSEHVKRLQAIEGKKPEGVTNDDLKKIISDLVIRTSHLEELYENGKVKPVITEQDAKGKQTAETFESLTGKPMKIPEPKVVEKQPQATVSNVEGVVTLFDNKIIRDDLTLECYITEVQDAKDPTKAPQKAWLKDERDGTVKIRLTNWTIRWKGDKGVNLNNFTNLKVRLGQTKMVNVEERYQEYDGIVSLHTLGNFVVKEV